jgi:aminopeptidase N
MCQTTEAYRLTSVWSQILSSLTTVKSVFAEVPEISEALRRFTVKFVKTAVDKIGWEFVPGEDLLTGQLRSLLISNAGAAGHEATVAEAKRRFHLVFTGKDPNAIHPSLRLAVFQTVISNGGKGDYETIKKYYSTTTSVDGKSIALRALGCVRSTELAQDLLNFTFSPGVATQDRAGPAISLAANSEVRLTLWEYIKANWDSKIYPQLSGNTIVLEGFLRKALDQFASFEVEKDIMDFFKDKDQKGYDRGLRVVKNTITSAASYKERDTASLKQWANF